MLARFLSLAALFSSACVAQPRRPGAIDPLGLTNGWIEMNARHEIYVDYDAEPGVRFSSFPGEPAYPLYIELAGGLKPGQRKRINILADSYQTNLDGSYYIFRFAEAPGASAEPGRLIITTSDPRYRCHRDTLGVVLGRHYMTLAQRRRIDACLGTPAS